MYDDYHGWTIEFPAMDPRRLWQLCISSALLVRIDVFASAAQYDAMVQRELQKVYRGAEVRSGDLALACAAENAPNRDRLDQVRRAVDALAMRVEIDRTERWLVWREA